MSSGETSLSSDTRAKKPVERVETFQRLSVPLYCSYHVHRRFAEDVLEIDLETWLAGHPNGPAVVEQVDACLANSPQEPTLPTWLREELAVDGTDEIDLEPPDLDRLGDEQVEQRTAIWADLLAEYGEPQ